LSVMGDQKSTFEIFDSDGDGYLNQEEVGHVMRTMGYNPANKDVSALCGQLPDPDHVNYQQLQQLCATASRPSNNCENELLEAFRVFDKDESGLIPENDVRVIFTTLGETVTLEEVNYLLSQVQVDEAGRVRYAQFIKMMMKY